MLHARDDYNGRIVDLDGKVPTDEPVLFIRGQDRAAPATARAWADENDRLNGDPEMSNMVRDHADLMEVWQRTRNAKIADL